PTIVGLSRRRHSTNERNVLMTHARAARAPSSPSRPIAFPVWYVAGAVALLVGLVVFSRLLASPGYVDRLTFSNPTAYDVSIEVADEQRDGWMAIENARHGATTVAQEVFDIETLTELM